MTGQEKLPGAPKCVVCHNAADGYTEVKDKGEVPKTGDVAICFYCCSLNIYVISPLGVYSMRKPTTIERESLLADPEVARAVSAVGYGRRQWNGTMN